MGSLKPWQLVLMIVATIVLAVSLWMSLGGQKVKSASSFYMVDVLTGEVYKANIAGRRSVMVPAKSPTTLVRSIVPMIENENGDWEVESRFRQEAQKIMQTAGQGLAEGIDEGSWVVTAGIEGAEPYRYPE